MNTPGGTLDNPRLKQTYKILEKSGKVLTLSFIIEELIKKKLLDDSPARQSRLWTRLTTHCEIFTTMSSFGKAAVGLKEWVLSAGRPKRKRKFVGALPLRAEDRAHRRLGRADQKILRFQHKLGKEEIEESYLVLSRELLGLFVYSGDGFQLSVYCYGDYNFNAWVNSEFSTLHSPEVKKYYRENKLKAGDIVFTEKREDDPTGIHLFTMWQVEQLDLEDYSAGLKKKRTVITSEEIVEASDGQVTKGDDYDPVYLLSVIQKRDLVYKFLKHNGPSTVNEIARAISRELKVEKKQVERLSFVDFSDERIMRLSDGRIGLRVVEMVKIKVGLQKELADRGKFVKFVIIMLIAMIFVIGLLLLV